jgi:hypothetical protein
MNEEWTEKFWTSGTEVEVFNNNNTPIGTGVLLSDYNPLNEDDQSAPEIQLEDGKVLSGTECFWIPSEVAKEVRDKLAEKQIKDYAVNVDVEGYDGFKLEVNVFAENPDDAVSLACAVEPRYQDDDPFLLLVFIGEDDSSVFCTYPNLNEAVKHIKTIRGGRWALVRRDMEDDGEGTIIRTWEDEL